MFKYFQSLEQKRKTALQKATHPDMQSYLSTPFPSPKWRTNDFSIVSLDFETTGLNPQSEQILSYGKIEIYRGAISLGSAEHTYIKSKKEIPEASAVIHHITDDQASQGIPLKEALPRMLRFLRGKAMLVHYNRIELGFLDAACRKLYGSPFIIPTIDTLVLGERVIGSRNHSIEPARLRLFNLRDDFNLPKYKAHNALGDAMTTAELYLVLESEISPSRPATLKQLMV